ncbi:TlpA family protein disulfide reductase, partial [Mycobacterium avium subsp. hominissuis]|nr:TlpA family protein disulfide reductase [Mycobacterium avium subsp. hominissuis]
MPIPRPTLTRKVRWHIAILAVVVALIVALLAQLRDDAATPGPPATGRAVADREHRD